MTRDEYRNACIEAGAKAFFERHSDRVWNYQPPEIKTFWRSQFAYAFDALHGIARVCPVEATEEMLPGWVDRERRARLWINISTAGDLTNQPEKKS